VDFRPTKEATESRRKNETVISMGCGTANVTVRDAVKSTESEVIEGMVATGLTNARMSLDVKGEISFKDCKILPMSQQKKSG
jgi:hypothetical protein